MRHRLQGEADLVGLRVHEHAQGRVGEGSEAEGEFSAALQFLADAYFCLGDGKAGTVLRVDLLASAPSALRRRALRLWIERCRGDLKRLERVHVVALEGLVLGNRSGRMIELPGGARVVSRKRGLLQFTARISQSQPEIRT